MRLVKAFAVGAAVLGVAAGSSPALSASPTLGMVHNYGVVRLYGGVWGVLDDTGHEPAGLLRVTCESTGYLVIEMTPISQVGTASVTPDEKYAGSFVVGASVGLDRVVLTIKTPSGAMVPCSSSSLAVSSSNFWVDVWGEP